MHVREIAGELWCIQERRRMDREIFKLELLGETLTEL
jgi:hypothetical protein